MAFEYLVESGTGAFLVEGGAYIHHKLIDSFERGDISPYTDQVGTFQAVENTTYAAHGSWVLEYNSAQGGSAGVVSLSGLPRYPTRGDTIRAFGYMLGEANGGGVQFACQEDRNTFPQGYRVSYNLANSGALEVVYQNPADGTTQTLGSDPIDLTGHADELLELRVEWGSPTITGRLYGAGGTLLGEATGDDSSWDSGGFGWAASTDEPQAADQYVYQDFATLIS